MKADTICCYYISKCTKRHCRITTSTHQASPAPIFDRLQYAKKNKKKQREDHVARFTKPSTSVFSYYKRPKTGAGEGLRTRQHTNRARLTVCELGIFSREISQLLKICPSPRFEEPLKFITHGHIFERSGYKLFHKCASLQAKDRAHWEQDLTLLLCALQSMLVAGLLCQ